MTRRSILCMGAGVAATLMSACGPADLSGPPTIRLGRDECAGCGMLVSEERCSCAMLVEQDGRRLHLVFDDLGCLLDYRSDHPDTVVVDAFVHDYGTGAWAPCGPSHFLVGGSDALSTPMGSGIVAFATQDGAMGQQAKSGGETADYQRLMEARRVWRMARNVQPTGSP